jgi:hypothetical protein
LRNRTAAVTFDDVTLLGSQLTANLIIESQVAHKFPTGFPSRRAWLHFTVHDADGQLVFESGALGPEGSIVGNDNDADPATYEPHYMTIDRSDQVQVYETIMGDTEGDPTTTLLRAATYLKDNRLLPSGVKKQTAQDDIAVYGLAADDQDFLGNGDKIQYTVGVNGADGPFTVTAELLYQSIGYRWANNLSQYQAPEIGRFLSYYQDIPNLPVVVASESVEVSE